jgi:hypothetical protein
MWGFRYGFKLGNGNSKIMARTGVFARVVWALKRYISCKSKTDTNYDFNLFEA